MVSLGGDMAVGTFSHGIPQLVFPSQFEQHVVATLIERLGGGVMIRPPVNEAPGTPAGVDAALERVLGAHSYTMAARAFRQRYPAWTPAEQLRRVVARIGELVAA
jgi:UDP:flavonoid glycosyltransferase YjiC (YdhE family)